MYILFLVHAVSASILFYLGAEFDVQNYVYYDRYDFSLEKSEREILFYLNPIYLVASNELVCALSNLWAKWKPESYSKWFSYSITAGLLSLAVVQGPGPLNIFFIPFILMGNLNVQFLGYLIDRGEGIWNYAQGYLLLLPVIILSFGRTLGVKGGKPRIAYPWLSFIYLIWYLTFPLWSWVSEGNPKGKEIRERGFRILSASSKLVLSWLLTSILLEPQGEIWATLQIVSIGSGFAAAVVLFIYLFVEIKYNCKGMKYERVYTQKGNPVR